MQESLGPIDCAWSVSAFVRNLLLCHVLPFTYYSGIYMILKPDYTLKTALKNFIYFYMRDLFLFEVINLIFPKILSLSLLCPNRKFLISMSRNYYDMNIIWYKDPFASHYLTYLSYEGGPTPKNCFSFIARLIMYFFSNIFKYLLYTYAAIGYIAMCGCYLYNKDYKSAFLIYLDLVLILLTRYSLYYYSVGQPAIFDRYYASYHWIMQDMNAIQRNKFLFAESMKNAPKIQRMEYEAKLAIKESHMVREKAARLAAKEYHANVLLAIYTAKKQKALDAATNAAALDEGVPLSTSTDPRESPPTPPVEGATTSTVSTPLDRSSL
jgi:hypothetical protein